MKLALNWTGDATLPRSRGSLFRVVWHISSHLSGRIGEGNIVWLKYICGSAKERVERHLILLRVEESSFRLDGGLENRG